MAYVCRSTLAFEIGRLSRLVAVLVFIAAPITDIHSQTVRDFGRGAQVLELQEILDRRTLVTGGVLTEGGSGYPIFGSKPRRNRPIPGIDDRNIMPMFPDVGPGTTPLVIPSDSASAPLDLAVIASQCGDAVTKVINDLKAPHLRQLWYSACTETRLPSEFDLLRQAAGGITEAGRDNYFCSGVLLDSQTLMTAKHCFFDSRTGLATPQWELLKTGKIEVRSSLGRFALSCGGGQANVVPCIPRFPGGFGLSADHILLSVSNLQSAKYSGVPHGKLGIGSELVLYGHFDGGSDRRYTRAPGCRVQAVSGRCVLHGCQADHSSSGAGLFFRDTDGKLKVGGIHLSGATESPDCGFGFAVQSNIGLSTSN